MIEMSHAQTVAFNAGAAEAGRRSAELEAEVARLKHPNADEIIAGIEDFAERREADFIDQRDRSIRAEAEVERLRALAEATQLECNRLAEDVARLTTLAAFWEEHSENQYEQRKKERVEIGRTSRLRAAVREAQFLESINREREERRLPLIYNPTVYAAALRGEGEK